MEEIEAYRNLLRDSARQTVFWRGMWRSSERMRAKDQAELKAYRENVTTGGPPAPITPGWKPGDSSRPPTAPPVDEVVELPE